MNPFLSCLARTFAVRVSRIAACALLSLIWAGSPLRAQQEAPGVFSEVIDVRVVNLEVVVTDKDGARVHGLKPEDFVLTVDRKEVPIEYFTEVFGGTAVVRDDPSKATTLPALAPGEPVGTSYLVFIDEYFSLAVHRDRLLHRMIDQLPLLTPQDRMAVVAFDGKRLEMLSTWTSSVETLTRTFQKAMGRPAQGLQRESEQRIFKSVRELRDEPGFVTSEIGLAGSRLDTKLDLDEQQQADLVAEQVERTVLAAAAALRSFAKPPGRKAMLLLSGGWPYNPAEWVVRDRRRAVLVSASGKYGDSLFKPLIETANRLSYTLYPIDVPGLDTALIDSSQFEIDSPGRVTDQEFQLDREQNEQLSLTVLARETGGRPLLNSANIEALDRVVEDTRSYYWLGFTPSWRGDDASHEVKLKTRREDLEVRSRASFSDLSRQTEVTMMVESSLLFGNPPSAAPLSARLGAPEKSGLGKVTVPIEIAIPLGALTFLPQKEGFASQVELRVAVLDDEGSTADIPVIPMTLTGPRQPTTNDFSVYRNTLKLRKKKHDLVISLYDVASGTILSTKLEFTPPAQ